MQTKFKKIMVAIMAIGLVALTVSSVYAFGDSAGQTPIPVVGNADNVASMVTPFIIDMATKHAWLLAVLAAIGIMRLVFKPIISIVETVVKQTPGDADDKFLAKCEASVWYRWLWFAADWLGSIKPPGSPTTNPLITKQGSN